MASSNSDIIIRRSTAADLQPLRQIRLEMLQDSPTSFSADLEQEKQREDAVWLQRIEENPIFLAWDGDTAVGMAGFYHDRTPKTGHHGVVWGVYVQPAYRGRALCGRLVNRCLQYAREQGLLMAYIATAATNTAAVRCYARCGFSVYGLQPMAIHHEGVYHDELLMAQKL